MKKTRLSVDIDNNEHKFLKMCCAKLGMSIKEFVVEATINAVDEWEDKWWIEKWEKDGTLEEMKREENDPNRVVYELVSENGEDKFVEKKWSDIVSERMGFVNDV
jgi:hypothetical protein